MCIACIYDFRTFSNENPSTLYGDWQFPAPVVSDDIIWGYETTGYHAVVIPMSKLYISINALFLIMNNVLVYVSNVI